MTQHDRIGARNAKMIANLYQVAVDPSAYDDLLTSWESILADMARLGVPRLDDPELSDHADRAGKVLERLSASSATSHLPAMAQTIELDDGPACLLSNSGRVIAANAAALRLFGLEHRHDPLAGFTTRLADALKPGQSTTAVLRQETRGSVLGVLEITAPELLFAVSRARCAQDPNVAALMSVPGPVWQPHSAQVLAAHYGLTEAELEVIKQLVKGLSAREIAEGRGTSPHTVRSQIKTVLSKTEVSSQGALIRNFGFLRPGPGVVTPAQVTQLQRLTGSLKHVVLPSGRKMPYRRLGAQNGRPVLFLHGLVDCLSYPTSLLCSLARQGVSLIAPERPGFGSASALPQKADTLTTVADDCVALLKHLGLGPLPVMGHMAGALYAYMLAIRYPERISQVLSVAGAVPMAYSWQIAGMSRGHRISALTSRQAPWLMPVLIRGGIQLLRTRREERMLDLYFSGSAVDKAEACKPEIRSMMLERFQFMTRQGHGAFHRDIVEVSRDWRDLAAQIPCPVAQIHGRHDSVVHAPGVLAFVDSFPEISLHIEEDAGQLLLTHKPEVVMDWALDQLLD